MDHFQIYWVKQKLCKAKIALTKIKVLQQVLEYWDKGVQKFQKIPIFEFSGSLQRALINIEYLDFPRKIPVIVFFLGKSEYSKLIITMKKIPVLQESRYSRTCCIEKFSWNGLNTNDLDIRDQSLVCTLSNRVQLFFQLIEFIKPQKNWLRDFPGNHFYLFLWRYNSILQIV